VVIRPSGGKDAVTFFRVLKRFQNATFVEIRPKTGRTHQIRVHFAHMGHPVLGDALYGVQFPPIKRQALHALSIGFEQPRTKKWIHLTSKLPEDMQGLLRFLESQA
jgi:23S rRNA pseudouridine1911/1915/1917 synthase